ncbi:MAG TPA: TIGR03435 family protein [Bryobacteraceae bacterium]|nr:TIGR03435 family protein [Bryobacteraceae bacterium]
MRVLALLILAGALHAQNFEAASIRPAPSGREGSVVDFEDTGLLHAANASLKFLIRSAYNVQADQIIGGPKWLDSDRYDVEAKTGQRIREADEQPLLRHLLADRFQLKTHTETRELTVYKLEIAKNGPLLKRSQSNSSEIHSNRGAGRNQISVVRIGLQQFAGMLGKFLGRIVEDGTGLSGDYDFTLTWSPDGVSDSTPSLFAALQEQMGLRLESGKAIMDVLVVDSAEKASEN